MKLYVANCTRQNWTIQYRLDFNTDGNIDQRRQAQPAKQQDIPPGRQIMVASPDLHISQIDEIVQQLQRYGMVGVADVAGLKTSVKKFDPRSLNVTPLVFNVGLPVPADVMRRIQDVNARIYVEQGRERRARAAVGVNELVQNKIAHEAVAAGVNEPPAERVEVAFEQLEESGAGEKPVAEGYRVSNSAPPPPTSSRKKNRRKAA